MAKAGISYHSFITGLKAPVQNCIQQPLMNC